ncbi:hypothetical protein CEG14_17545 [Bordetella genomosp. 1]|uniref:Uncharacterized protein n=1 Tax=Bordetella genomosp. 1 TaxID=1395607 RepID=A0A261S6G3_9BORD|nr:hypothetical protein [Bordetella genomosp. 1]MDQ8035136.1 hypothetical protein [Bordetella sp.]OZI32711.1 hypothetical protein CEG14_17545 [Bordetella genomosp. 1]OZI66130.1 hypothetical protein CAL27_13185 [Bordetella genomosp. 1]
MEKALDIAKIEAEISKLVAESLKLHAEGLKLHAEDMKLHAEVAKMTRERTWYPFVVITAGLTSTFAAGAVIAKLIWP